MLTEGVKITLAQVAEVCTRNYDVYSALKSLVELLEKTEDGVEDGGRLFDHSEHN